jgi:hypothetical protein
MAAPEVGHRELLTFDLHDALGNVTLRLRKMFNEKIPVSFFRFCNVFHTRFWTDRCEPTALGGFRSRQIRVVSPPRLDLRRASPRAPVSRMRGMPSPGTWRLLIGRERFQESDQIYSALRRCQTPVGLHGVAGHYFVGVRDEAPKVFLIPNEVCAPHSAGIRVVWQRPSLPSDDASHVRAEPIVALPDRMARSAGVVKYAAATERPLEVLETEKQNETVPAGGGGTKAK